VKVRNEEDYDKNHFHEHNQKYFAAEHKLANLICYFHKGIARDWKDVQ